MDNSYAFKLDHIKTGKSPIPRGHFPSSSGCFGYFPGMILIKYGFGKIVKFSENRKIVNRNRTGYYGP